MEKFDYVQDHLNGDLLILPVRTSAVLQSPRSQLEQMFLLSAAGSRTNWLKAILFFVFRGSSGPPEFIMA
jgi:hypothetical protein